MPPQRAGGSSKPVDEGDIQYVAFKVGRFHMAKTKCPEVQGGSLNPGRAKSVPGAHGNRGTWQNPSPGTLTRVPKRPRSEGSTLIKKG
jgi:hypothetical protein